MSKKPAQTYALAESGLTYRQLSLLYDDAMGSHFVAPNKSSVDIGRDLLRDLGAVPKGDNDAFARAMVPQRRAWTRTIQGALMFNWCTWQEELNLGDEEPGSQIMMDRINMNEYRETTLQSKMNPNRVSRWRAEWIGSLCRRNEVVRRQSWMDVEGYAWMMAASHLVSHCFFAHAVHTDPSYPDLIADLAVLEWTVIDLPRYKSQWFDINTLTPAYHPYDEWTQSIRMVSMPPLVVLLDLSDQAEAVHGRIRRDLLSDILRSRTNADALDTWPGLLWDLATFDWEGLLCIPPGTAHFYRKRAYSLLLILCRVLDRVAWVHERNGQLDSYSGLRALRDEARLIRGGLVDLMVGQP